MRRLLVLGLLLGALAGLITGLQIDRTPAVSRSQVVLSVGPGFRPATDAAATEDQYLSNRMSTYAELALSDRVLGPAAAQLGTTTDALRPAVAVSAVPGGNLLAVEVAAPTSEVATAGAQAVDESLMSAITTLETRPGAVPPIAAAVDSAPSVPAAPFAPPLGLAVAVGAVAGLAVVLLAAALRATGLVQRAARALLRWVFSTPDAVGPPLPMPPRAPAVSSGVSVPEQVRRDSAADTDPATATATAPAEATS